MTDYTKIKEIALTIEESEFEFVGIRIQEEVTEKIGETMNHKSNVWEDGEKLEEKLNGVCAIDYRDAVRFNDSKCGGYMGEIIYILGSDRANEGNDDGELVMIKPVVLKIIRG